MTLSRIGGYHAAAGPRMRIGILSDIHSNLEALSETLAGVEKHRPDMLICLGDVVGYGASPNECCALTARPAR